jgi:hypothetical protein
VRVIGRGEEVQLLSHRTGTHVDVEHVLDITDAVTGLLHGLPANGRLCVVEVEQPGRRLDQIAVGMVVDVGRIPKLLGQQHRSPRKVVEQDRGAVAAVIGLAGLAGPFTVIATVVECRGVRTVPVVTEEANIGHPHPVARGGRILSRHPLATVCSTVTRA